MRRRSARPGAGRRFPGPDLFPRTTHAEGRHPHPRGAREAQAGDRASLRHAPARGRGAHQEGAGVRRHLGELRVRRRQERAGDARVADRPAQVIDASELDNALVRVGSLVSVKDEKGKSFQYTIVGSTEADPSANRLSNESPVGKALIGRKKGEAVAVPTPRGERKLTISKISVA